MKRSTRIVRIGNSRGIRIPKVLLDALGFDVRLDLDGRSLFPGAERDDERVITARTDRGIDAELRLIGARARLEVAGPGASRALDFGRLPDGPWEADPGAR